MRKTLIAAATCFLALTVGTDAATANESNTIAVSYATKDKAYCDQLYQSLSEKCRRMRSAKAKAACWAAAASAYAGCLATH